MAQSYRSSRSRGGGRSSGGRGGGGRSGGGRSGGGRSGGGRNGGGRGGYGPPQRSGGGSGPMVAAILVVVGVIVLVVVLSSGKGKDDSTSNTSSTSTTVPTVRPSETQPPPPPPYPAIDSSLKQKAADIVKQADELKQQGEAVYTEAMAAHKEGNDELWQAKLAEAAEFYLEIQELWNDFIAEMPDNADYDQEDVANYYFGQEGSKITSAMSRLTDIKKQRRL